MAINIPGLVELTVKDIDGVTELFMDAFQEYPKLDAAFPEKEKKMAALEATIRYYGAYDLKFGKGYSLDKQLNDAVLIVESDQMNYSFFRHLRAGSYSKKYKQVMKTLDKDDQRKRVEMFKELDTMERALEFPMPHLFLDFLGVRTVLQGQGKGRRLMDHVCDYANKVELPIILFTNTEADIKFYKSLGFEIPWETHSDKFKFTNWYMVRYPELPLQTT